MAVAYKHCLLLSSFVVAICLSSLEMSQAGRHLLDIPITLPLPTIPTLPAIIPTLPVTLPPLPTLPVEPTLPPLGKKPVETTLAKAATLPTTSQIPSLTNPTLPNLPAVPKATLPALPTGVQIPKVTVTVPVIPINP